MEVVKEPSQLATLEETPFTAVPVDSIAPNLVVVVPIAGLMEMHQTPELESQVQLDVIGTKVVATRASSLLVEPVSVAQPTQPKDEGVEVMDQASVFLRQQFRLTPSNASPSI